MPFIHTITNKSVSESQEAALRRRFGEAITLLPGKSEEWLMLALSDERPMAFRANASEDLAMIEVSLSGKAPTEAKNDLTGAITAIVSEELGIRGDHIYITYAETDTWGYDGENF